MTLSYTVIQDETNTGGAERETSLFQMDFGWSDDGKVKYSRDDRGKT